MKKFIPLFLSAAIFGGVTVNASVITPDEALSRLSSSAVASKILAKSRPQLKMTKYVEDRPVIYIFSKGDNNGFIAVSADDNSIPLLGYTEEGSFNGTESEMPDGLSYWLTSLGEQIAANSALYVPAKETPRDYIAPLVKTKWNQSAPYNNDCPTVNGTRCVTGCVATAMAQALKYYNYPTKGTGTYSYSWNNQTLTFNYGNTTFDWANMTDTYDSSSTSVQNAAVAKLMYACGVSVQMNYGTGSSGAVSSYMVRALTENFGYDKSVEYLQRDYYSLSEWEDIVYDNLKNYGPVLYGGQSTSGGHEFICDGYDNGYFHFNWGWGGMSDGYFLLTALNPSSQGIGGSTGGYNFDQDIIIKLSTTNTTQYGFEQMCLDGDFTITQRTSTLGSTINYSMTTYNYSGIPLPNVTIGVQIVSADGSYSTFIPAFTYSGDLPNYSGWSSLSRTAQIPSNLTSGTYTIRPAFLCETARNVVTPMRATINNRGSYTMTVSGSNVTFGAPAPAELSAKDIQFTTDLYVNNQFRAVGTLTNTSDSQEYYQPIALVAYDSSGKAVAAGDEMMLDLQAGETLDWEYVSTLFTFSGATITSGKSYDFYLCNVSTTYQNGVTYYSYTKLSGPFAAVINTATTTTLSINDLQITSNDDHVTATATVRCTAGYFSGTLPLYIFPYVNGSVTSIASYNSEFFSVGANSSTAPSSVKITYDFKFDAAQSNTSYFGEIRFNNAWISNQAIFRTGIVTGIDEATVVTPEVQKTEYYTLTGVLLNEKPTQHGIYIIVEHYDDGTVKSRRAAF